MKPVGVPYKDLWIRMGGTYKRKLKLVISVASRARILYPNLDPGFADVIGIRDDRQNKCRNIVN